MSMEPHSYCKIFVHGPANARELIGAVEEATGQTASGASIFIGRSTIDIRENEDRDDSKMDRFVHWPFYLDAGPDDMSTDESLVPLITTVLEHLWGKSWSTVAACDFEEELPSHPGFV